MFKHIIVIDDKENITGIYTDNADSDVPLRENEIEFEQSESEIFLTPDGTMPWGVFGRDNRTWVPLYRYDSTTGEISARPREDVDADLDKIVVIPSDSDRLEAQVTYTAMMTDTLLEG